MRLRQCHLVWFALALCAGCAAPYPSVPQRDLAERILEQPRSNDAASTTMMPLPDPTPQQVPADPLARQIERSSAERNQSPGRRLNISQTSAFAAPLDPPSTLEHDGTGPTPEGIGIGIPLASAPVEKLTLAAAIDLAYRMNPAIQSARNRLEIARAGNDIAYADFLPELGIGYRHVVGATQPSGFVLPTIAAAVGNVAFGGSAEEFDVAELRAQWTLWDFGRRSAKYGQALITQEIAGLQYVRRQQTVAFDVASAYFEALGANASADIAQESVRRAQSALGDAKNFLHRGNAIRNDVLRADVFLKEMQLDLVRAQTSQGIAIAKLNRAIGINPTCTSQIVDVTDPPPFDLPLCDCLQMAVENRREFGVVEHGIAKAKLGASAAGAEFMPKVVVGGLGALQQEHDPTRYAEHGSAGIGIELGLFQGGRRIGEVREAKSEIDVAVADGKEVCDQIAYEVKVAYLTINDAVQRMKVAKAAAAQASENFRIVGSLSEQGDAIATEVIDAQLTLTRAQQGYLIARYDYETALARLAFAVGLPPERFLAVPAAR
ncbi:MAG TPA: TolC family protein [Pirellulales bacterium]|jgi:outer membrane protein TolC